VAGNLYGEAATRLAGRAAGSTVAPMRRPLVAIIALLLVTAGSAIALLAPAADDAGVRATWQTIDGWGLTRFARDATALGSHGVVLALMLAVAGCLALERRGRLAVAALGVGVGAVLINVTVKALVMRPRPDLGLTLELASTSFPSGHSLLAAATWPWFGHLLGTRLDDPRARAWLVGVGIATALCVGGSRLALGVHRPSEVLAGWGLGLGWGWLCARWAMRPVTARAL
jgi:membrane-associated phospholipid phosphatase